MKKYFAVIGSLLLLAACATVAPTDTQNGDAMEGEESSTMMDNSESSDAGLQNGGTTEDAGGDGVNGDVDVEVDAGMSVPRVIRVTAEDWAFTPSTITAKKGEKVTLQITAASGTHGFAVPDLGVNATIAAGQTVSVTLPTDKAGTFSGMCSVPCGQGHKDMRFTVVISE